MALLQGLQNAVDKGRARRQVRQQGLSGQAMAAPKVPLQPGSNPPQRSAPPTAMNQDMFRLQAQTRMGLQSAQAAAQQGVGQRMAQGVSAPQGEDTLANIRAQIMAQRGGTATPQPAMYNALQGMAQGGGPRPDIMTMRRLGRGYSPPGQGLSMAAFQEAKQ